MQLIESTNKRKSLKYFLAALTLVNNNKEVSSQSIESYFNIIGQEYDQKEYDLILSSISKEELVSILDKSSSTKTKEIEEHQKPEEKTNLNSPEPAKKEPEIQNDNAFDFEF